ASVLRMLEQYMGPEVFRGGVRTYLDRHAYGNTETADLWHALANASRLDIPALMDGWVFRPGYPIVTAAREGNDLVLTQQRFSYLPLEADTDPSRCREPSGTGSGPARLAGPTEADTDQRWQVPVQIRLETPAGVRAHRVLLTERETRVALPEG